MYVKGTNAVLYPFFLKTYAWQQRLHKIHILSLSHSFLFFLSLSSVDFYSFQLPFLKRELIKKHEENIHYPKFFPLDKFAHESESSDLNYNSMYSLLTV